MFAHNKNLKKCLICINTYIETSLFCNYLQLTKIITKMPIGEPGA